MSCLGWTTFGRLCWYIEARSLCLPLGVASLFITLDSLRSCYTSLNIDLVVYRFETYNMALVDVWTGNGSYEVDSQQLVHFFPLVWDFISGHLLDLPSLVRPLSANLPARSRKSALRVLKSLFGIFKVHHAWDHDLAAYVAAMIDRSIHDDTFGKTYLIRGLQRSRNAFATLAALAEITGSWHLAIILIDVFWGHRRTVADCDRPGSIDGWARAIELLRGLVPPHDINKCVQYLAREYNGDLGFGRGRHLWRRDYFPAPRARTMPPVHYCPRISPRPGFLPLPAPEPMYHPLPSPAVSMGYVDPYRDAEMDEMKMEQEILRDKVDLLEWNQAEINAAVQMPVSGQLQLPWGGAY